MPVDIVDLGTYTPITGKKKPNGVCVSVFFFLPFSTLGTFSRSSLEGGRLRRKPR